MDLIFWGGDKLYEKHIKKREEIKKLAKVEFVLDQSSQRESLEQLYKGKDYNIYGDDFKIEITPKNILGDCTLSIQDFDENQCLESVINVGFNKDELKQFVSLLSSIEEKM